MLRPNDKNFLIEFALANFQPKEGYKLYYLEYNTWYAPPFDVGRDVVYTSSRQEAIEHVESYKHAWRVIYVGEVPMGDKCHSVKDGARCQLQLNHGFLHQGYKLPRGRVTWLKQGTLANSG